MPNFDIIKTVTFEKVYSVEAETQDEAVALVLEDDSGMYDFDSVDYDQVNVEVDILEDMIA